MSSKSSFKLSQAEKDRLEVVRLRREIDRLKQELPMNIRLMKRFKDVASAARYQKLLDRTKETDRSLRMVERALKVKPK